MHRLGLFAHGDGVTLLTFAHPGLLAGLTAAVAPLVIHWVGRRHAPTIAFAAFDFLMAVNARLAARERLRQWLLLALRTLAVLLVVLAMARPTPQEASQTSAQLRRVALVVDTSLSMAYVEGDVPLVHHAVARALEVVSHLAPGDAVTLIAAGSVPKPLLLAPTVDHNAVRHLLDTLKRTAPRGTADMGEALKQAAQQLGEAAQDTSGSAASPPALPQAQRDIFVISDLAHNSFVQLTPFSAADAPAVHLIDASGHKTPQTRPNVAIRGVTIGQGAAHTGPLERTFAVHLENFGDTAAQSRPIALTVDDAVVVHAVADVAAHAAGDKLLTHTFAAPGLYRLAVRLAPDGRDGRQDDDVWRGQLHIVPPLRVLAVDGEPRAAAYDDELYFVQRALEAVPASDAPIAVETVAMAQLAGALGQTPPPDVCVLAHPTHLESAMVTALTAFVESGGGLLVSLGAHADFEALNDKLAALLPAPLRDLTRAADPGTQASSLGIGSFDWTHPVLHDLGAGAEASLRQSRTAQYFNLDTGAGTQGRVLLGFDNGAPALIEQRRVGAGRIMLWTTSIDVDLTDLPLRTAFVPLMQKSARYLGDALGQSPKTAVTVGQSVTLTLPEHAASVQLTGPDGQLLQAQATSAVGQAVATLGPLDAAGLWTAEVRVGSETSRAPELDAMVNADLTESDYKQTTPEAVARALGQIQPGAPVVAQRVGLDAWHRGATGHTWTLWLLMALLGIVAAESLVAARG